jgi:DNA-binding MarR family transcriptional regulator
MTSPAGPTAPASSDDHESCARAWAALTAAHARVAGQLTAALQQACGLTITDFEILLRLGQAGQRVGELASPVRLSQPALSRAVARLAGRGWLARSGSPGDARGVLVTLTPAGQDVLATATAAHAATIRTAVLDRLSPAEQETLARVLARVADS